MSTVTLTSTHPVVACAVQIRGVLTDVDDLQPVFMTLADKQAALVELSRVESQVAELKARVLATADDVAVEHGARDIAAWLAHAVQADPRAARAELHLAKAIEQRPLVAAAMRAGGVSPAQARVITAAVADLPADLGPELARQAEQTLVGYAAHHQPAELRRLGRRILEVVAPDIAEAEEAKALEDEEAKAREKMTLRFRDLGDGATRFWGRLPTAFAQRLKHYLHAFTSPRRPHGEEDQEQRVNDPGPFGTRSDSPDDATGERMPQHRAYAGAFAALLELLDPRRLPEHGGDATTVLITMSLDQLRADLAAAGVIAGDGEEFISASEARRLACQATLIPVVLGAKGEVLDLGRGQRLFTKAQRKALRLRDKRCRAEGCSIPAAWTEAHHLTPWAEGGATDLANAISLCNLHHHRIHDRSYGHDMLPSGDVRFHRRS